MLTVEVPPQETSTLVDDERWRLAQRIAASRGFQRAGQLRSILLYLVAECILHPERLVREHELAHEVLGRPGNFDPLTDNIVRAQMSHLRRRLEAYYAEEGRHETLRVVLPKGSYQPQFHEIVAEAAASETPIVEVPTHLGDSTAPKREKTLRRNRQWLTVGLAAMCVALTAITLFLWSRERPAAIRPASEGEANEFVKFLVRSEGPVSIIMPDTSLMMLQNALGTDITVSEYLNPAFLSDQISHEPDPKVRKLLLELRDKRNTSIGESAAAADIVGTLTANGLYSSVRYARDMHTRDLGEGNSIIIGSQRSNPWTKLFEDQLNFSFRQDGDPTLYSFWNLHPQAGEQAHYVPYVLQSGKYSSYIDVAICPNLTHSGYVMLVIGSDMQGNEAAVRFLLHGTLPPAVSNLFVRRDPGVYEVFLQSQHEQGEAEENFDVVAVRSTPSP